MNKQKTKKQVINLAYANASGDLLTASMQLAKLEGKTFDQFMKNVTHTLWDIVNDEGEFAENHK